MKKLLMLLTLMLVCLSSEGQKRRKVPKYDNMEINISSWEELSNEDILQEMIKNSDIFRSEGKKLGLNENPFPGLFILSTF